MPVRKAPSVSESIDWARTLLALEVEEVDAAITADTLHVLLKYQSDIDKVIKDLDLSPPRRRPDMLHRSPSSSRSCGPSASRSRWSKRWMPSKRCGYVDLADREAVRAGLGATMVKNARHDGRSIRRSMCSSVSRPPRSGPDDDDRPGFDRSAPAGEGAAGVRGGADVEGALFEAILGALRIGDRRRCADLVRRAVDRLSGLRAGPTGGRSVLPLSGDAPPERRGTGRHRLMAGGARRRVSPCAGTSVSRLRMPTACSPCSGTEVRREIVRRLVEDRGPEAVARTLRTPLVEDIDLMHATREELTTHRTASAPLARKLATRLAPDGARGRKGRLDVRRTIRRSLAHGGALVDPKFKPPRISKPELVLLCDVSGSMATFARFTMQLTFAIGHQFSKVRSFAFIDGIDEVTDYFGPGSDFHDALVTMGREARIGVARRPLRLRQCAGPIR